MKEQLAKQLEELLIKVESQGLQIKALKEALLNLQGFSLDDDPSTGRKIRFRTARVPVVEKPVEPVAPAVPVVPAEPVVL